jgi:xanthine dehydrogenase small subunit
MWDHVIFYLNGRRIAVGGDDVFLPLVEFLRDRKRLRGTKVGCAEGDCGACTVLIGVPEAGTIRYRPATSCIRPLHQLDGTHVVTIEGLTPPDGTSAVQQAMIDHHGSQCGFCTPGFVVAIEGVLESGTCIDDAALRTGLAGNLCRCTGYLPILDAAMAADAGPSRRLSSLYPPGAMVDELAGRAGVPILIETGRRTFYRP